MVDFVGAGPGAADLITVRGKELIEKADIIIYAGTLVNKEILKYAGKECEIFNSGEMTLEEVIDIMKKGDKNGKRIVRLHTGDASIYGAVREQLDELEKAGIEYRICPGVSSMLGAAASLGAEFTLPGVSQSIIVTRMEGRTPVPEKEDISKLAQHNASMVIFLSAGMTEELSRRLIKGGYREDTPAAIVYKATWEEERIVRTSVGNLHKSAVENGINKTALILIGDFLKNKYDRSRLYDPKFSHSFRKGTEA